MLYMPKIYLDYAKFLQKQQKISKVRQVYNQALQTLPTSQHPLIWQQYLEWAQSLAFENREFVLIAKHAYKRYVKLKPERMGEYLDFLLRNDQLEDALSLYVHLIA